MFDKQNRFVIEDYQSQPPFSSFLPGIAGELGIPLWCYYNNRGQAVCSFGAQDKDHAIMEFSPAHVAYRDVSRTGFRTFAKVNGRFTELFTEKCDMHIGMGELEITCRQEALRVSAVYFGIPEERTAALGRILTVENTTDQTIELELLDGMAAIVPFGLNQDFLKNMTQLSKAWMQCEDQEQGRAYFRVRASLEDGAVVREVKGGNFCLGFDEEGNLLSPVVQPTLVFGQDTSLALPRTFQSSALSSLTQQPQVTSNQFLCCFLPRCLTLEPGKAIGIYSLYGQAESKMAVSALSEKAKKQGWFDAKRQLAQTLVEKLTAPIACKTGSSVLDAYAKQTYLDNLLRGGAPMFFQNGDSVSPFHIYSRKHGDPEREYNYFSLGKEYYAQGNGNYRDVNQNRRCDVLFAPETKDYNIRTFFDLIQTDGYNPLVVLPCTYQLSEEKCKAYIQECPSAEAVLSGDFTPGQLAMAAEDSGMDCQEIKDFTARVICDSLSEPNANFGEGYWCDHWTYNLDLIESYLSVYPDQKDTLLFTENTCRWYDTKVLVNPRAKRYCITENGLRQYYALDETAKKASGKWMKLADGTVARSSLAEKLLLLCAIKTATLDAWGMGVEMEGGRPGWYDALNGLPGLLGSSMAESCELARLLAFTAETLENRTETISLYKEVAQLITSVCQIIHGEEDLFRRWDALNTLKEDYRRNTMYGYNGDRVPCSAVSLAKAMRAMEETVLWGIQKAEAFTGGLIPTYFIFTAKDVRQTKDGPMPTALEPKALPLFLEGAVRYLKLPLTWEKKSTIPHLVKASGLYDPKLHMYKVNESLRGVSYEAGRALAFTPGWLENESIWLHMEYKYLLELLKNGLYSEFSQAFRDAAIPFLDPRVYGRSVLENVSFIASSANPDPQIHGQGFVARLSGSTAEFIHMWQILFFGSTPFRWYGKALSLCFEPYIPEYLMGREGLLEATFLGKIPVTYHTGTLTELVPGKTAVQKYAFTFRDSHTETVHHPAAGDSLARAVRDGHVTRIEVFMK